MNPLVSIIVPVYNAEKTIGRCIESILKQDYTNFELLIIDDGSKDNSGVICDEYAAGDNRIIVVHKENSGVSDSRNMALDMAQGTYLQFLDADDWITPNATRTFAEAAEDNKADMVISDFYRVVDKRVSQKGSIDKEGLLTREEFASEMMENPSDFYYGVLWNKLYRRDIIEKHHLRMDLKISWCEDFMFNLEYMRHAHDYYVVQLPLYYYVKTKGSLVSQGMSISKTIRMKLMVFEYYNNYYKEIKFIKVVKETNNVTVEFTENANGLLNEILLAENNYVQAKYADFSVEEMNQYLALKNKIKENTKKIL